MNPTPGDVHVNKMLTAISISYMRGDNDFIAPIVFPNVPVNSQSDLYWKYNREDWNRIEAQERAPATESAGSGYRLSQDSYFAKVYAFHKDVDDQTRANADSVLNMDTGATNFVSRNLMLKREKLWVDTYFKAAVWGTDVTGVAGAPGANQFQQWDQATSDPIGDIRKYTRATQKGTAGWTPNTLVLGPEVVDKLLDHPDIIDRIKYTQRGVVTLDMLAPMLGVNRVLTPAVVYNTAPEGAAESNAFMYGKSALLVYAAPNPAPDWPSGGYSFSWTGYLGAGVMGNRVKKFRMEEIASDRIEGEMAFDMKVVAPDLGTFLAAVVA